MFLRGAAKFLTRKVSISVTIALDAAISLLTNLAKT